MYRHSLRLLLLIIWLCYDAIYCYVVYAYFTSLPASNQFLVYCGVLFSYVYTISLASRLVLDTLFLEGGGGGTNLDLVFQQRLANYFSYGLH